MTFKTVSSHISILSVASSLLSCFRAPEVNGSRLSSNLAWAFELWNSRNFHGKLPLKRLHYRCIKLKNCWKCCDPLGFTIRNKSSTSRFHVLTRNKIKSEPAVVFVNEIWTQWRIIRSEFSLSRESEFQTDVTEYSGRKVVVINMLFGLSRCFKNRVEGKVSAINRSLSVSFPVFHLLTIATVDYTEDKSSDAITANALVYKYFSK